MKFKDQYTTDKVYFQIEDTTFNSLTGLSPSVNEKGKSKPNGRNAIVISIGMAHDKSSILMTMKTCFYVRNNVKGKKKKGSSVTVHTEKDELVKQITLTTLEEDDSLSKVTTIAKGFLQALRTKQGLPWEALTDFAKTNGIVLMEELR